MKFMGDISRDRSYVCITTNIAMQNMHSLHIQTLIS